MRSTTLDSPVGVIHLVSDGQAVVLLTIADRTGQPDARSERIMRDAIAGNDAVLNQGCRELTEYFDGTRTTFEVPTAFSGTAFQEQVWAELTRVDFGQTLSYGQLAARIGKPQAVRAVGRAVGANPVAIIIPCHRVLARDNRLTGFSTGTGIETKRLLLDREGITEYQV